MNAAIRPAIAGVLAGSYLFWRTKYTNFDMRNVALVTGSVWAADMAANVAFKRGGLYTSSAGIKSLGHMATAPALSGLLYWQGYRYMYPGDPIPMSKLVMLGAAVDAASERLSTPLKHMLQPDLPDDF
jgi:hypothetical protein